MNSITVNGKTINCSGSNVIIQNGNVIVDGKIVEKGMSGNVSITINGDVNNIDCTGSISVNGNCKNIDCGGSCIIAGRVDGDVDCGGSCNCGNVKGSVDAGGSIITR